MSEKQYRLNKWGTKLLRNNRPLFDWFNDSDDIVDLLNAFCDENEQLKQKVDFYKYFQKDARELEKENEQLKSKYSEQCIQLDFLKDENRHMRQVLEENKQLKQFKEQNIQEYTKLKKVCNTCKKENEQLKQLLRAEKTYETIELREKLSDETIEKFKQDLKDGEFIELTARPNVRKYKNDYIGWKND